MTIATIAHDAEVASRFDGLAGRFKAAVGAGDVRLLSVLRALAGLDRPTVLDLGCGKGRFARELAKAGARVVGLDLSAGMLAEGIGLDRVRGTARRLPFASGSFDALVAVEAFQHLGDVRPALAEARRVLRPGGRLVVVDRNALALDARRPWLPGLVVKWVDERRGRWMYPAGGPVRERWFVPSVMGRLLDRAGFASIEVEHLISPDEAGRAVFRVSPTARSMACWTATVPGRIGC